MESIFDSDTREKLIQRITKITPDDLPRWGKMNVVQMLKHNTYWNGWIQGRGEHEYYHTFLGKIFGKIALKRMIKEGKPFDKNIPTSERFKVKELTGDLESEKAEWIALIRAYEDYHNPEFVHDFFGKMTREQIGILAYKHTDHHLRQFGL